MAFRKIVALMEAYFEPRKAQVCVKGIKSKSYTLDNMIFQGTVLGPLMWIICSLELPDHVTSQLAHVLCHLFADDFTAGKVFPRSGSQGTSSAEMKQVQDKAHQWGKTNTSTFEKSKEAFVTISKSQPNGEVFRRLGPLIDPQLKMNFAIDAIVQQKPPQT